jgi:arylsulfatase A-like enzyme
LKRLGVYDSTTIIVTSDHGEGFGEHGYFLHAHHLFEEFIHVPLLVKPAKGTTYVPGTRVGTPSDSRDLFHSLSFLMGVKPGTLGTQGRCSWVSGGSACSDSIIVSEFGNFGIPRRAVIEGNRKVIYYGPVDRERFMATVGNPAWLPSVSFKNSKWMYFDLHRDPKERKPVSKGVVSKDPTWQKLKSVGAERQPSLNDMSTVKIDDDTIEDLRALGYID